jgi:hypothetical protein
MRKHLSVDMTSLEKHHDKFNIDWIRYYKRDSFLTNITVTAIVMLIWIKWLFVENVSFRIAGIGAAVGAIIYFSALLIICHSAQNSVEESARLASRRGLFSFATMTPIIIGLLAMYGKLGWQDLFSKTVTLMFMGQILCGFFAAGLDLLVPLLRHKFRR